MASVPQRGHGWSEDQPCIRRTTGNTWGNMVAGAYVRATFKLRSVWLVLKIAHILTNVPMGSDWSKGWGSTLACTEGSSSLYLTSYFGWDNQEQFVYIIPCLAVYCLNVIHVPWFSASCVTEVWPITDIGSATILFLLSPE